jgi:hypothetical protein
MDRRNSRRFRTDNTANLALAVMLVVAFLSSIAPLARVSAGSVCKLECCAGRAPHAAGSCMDGSCNAVLSISHKTTKGHQVKLNQGEQFCGLSRTTATKNVARMRVDRAPRPAKSEPTTALAAAFVKPCQPECGGCASGFASSNQQRNAGTLAHVVRPRPPTESLFDFGSHRTQLLNALCRQGAPRGPPFVLS